MFYTGSKIHIMIEKSSCVLVLILWKISSHPYISNPCTFHNRVHFKRKYNNLINTRFVKLIWAGCSMDLFSCQVTKLATNVHLRTLKKVLYLSGEIGHYLRWLPWSKRFVLVRRKVWRYQRGNQKDRQHNDQKKKDKRTKNDLQNIT